MVSPSGSQERQGYHRDTRAGRRHALRPPLRERDGRLVSQRAGTRRATDRPRPGPWPKGGRVRGPLLVAILGQWDDELAGGPALLRACGLTADRASQLAATLVAAHDGKAAGSEAEPWVLGGLRFVVDQACRIAAEAGAPYVGTEHLVVAILWMDCRIGAHELRRLGVSYAQAAEQLAALSHSERAERIDPLEMVEVPTPAPARLGELARQQAEQHPIEGDGRISTLHHLLALMVPRSAAGRLLRELGVGYEEVVRRIAEEGTRRVVAEDWRPEEHRLRAGRSSGSPTSRTR
jgi:Clp amino terminal domain, pathogenicity island component